MPPGSIGVNDPVEELLAAGVDPALLPNGAQDQKGLILLEFRVGGRAVNLRCGRKDDPLLISDALLYDVEIHFKIEVEDSDRVFHIELRCGDGNQGNDNVTLLNVIFNPLLQIISFIFKNRADG